MILVISSPSSSTTGFATAIFVSGNHNAWEGDQGGGMRGRLDEQN